MGRLASAWPGLLVAPFAAWAAGRLAGLDSYYPFVQLAAFTPYAALAAWLPLPLLALRRRWWPLACGVLAAAVLAGGVLPRAIADGDPLAGADGPRLRVLTANVLVGTADLDGLAGLVRDHHVDLLALQEVTPEFAAEVVRAELGKLLPVHVFASAEHAEGSALMSRYPLQDLGATVSPGGFRQARAMLTVPDGRRVEVESVHVFSPYAGAVTGLWRESLRAQPPATPDGRLRVLLGDFNATLDHRLLRNLIATGYRDAADVAGTGWVGTWGPYDGDPIPPVVLDHVLADTRIGVAAYAVLELRGSDHRPVLAELILP